MGYYTEYEIIVSDKVLEYMNENVDEFNEYGERLRDDPPLINAKWYSWKEDMQYVSEQFPDEVIEVRGNGEEGDDLWIVKFKGGKIIYQREFGWSMLEEGK